MIFPRCMLLIVNFKNNLRPNHTIISVLVTVRLKTKRQIFEIISKFERRVKRFGTAFRFLLSCVGVFTVKFNKLID